MNRNRNKEQDYDANHAKFAARLRAINASDDAKAAVAALIKLRDLYRRAALEHWKELGNHASTGWGQTPAADEYNDARDPNDCADWIARELIRALACHPVELPGGD